MNFVQKQHFYARNIIFQKLDKPTNKTSSGNNKKREQAVKSCVCTCSADADPTGKTNDTFYC